MYFRYLKNGEYIKDFQILMKEANCNFNLKQILNKASNPIYLISTIKKKCKK